MLLIGPAGPTVWPWSIGDTMQSQRRWSLDWEGSRRLVLLLSGIAGFDGGGSETKFLKEHVWQE